jgi:hypothetical protein
VAHGGVIEEEEQGIKEEKEEEDFLEDEEVFLEEKSQFAEILLRKKDAVGEKNVNSIILRIPRIMHLEEKTSKKHFKILRINRTLIPPVEQEDKEDFRAERKSVLMD